MIDYAEERRLIDAARGGDNAATLGLYRLHAGFIYKVCKYYWRHATQNDLGDYLQAGYIAVARAVADYDPGRGCKFTGWLGWKLRNECQALMSSGVVAISRAIYSSRKATPELHQAASMARRAWGCPTGGLAFGALHELSVMDRGLAAVDGADWWATVEARVRAIYGWWVGNELRSTLRSHHPHLLARRRVTVPARARRDVEFILLVLRGMPPTAAGRVVGVTRERARQLCGEFAVLAHNYRMHLLQEAGHGYGRQMVG